MKKLVLKFSVLFLLSTYILVNISCSDDSDTSKPEIQINKPTENESIIIGEENGFIVDIDFKDNEELSSYKVDVHFGEDHNHTRTDHDNDHNDVDKYEHSSNGNLTGKRDHVNFKITIPSGVRTGKYHLVVYCTDQAGNESYVARNIYLSEDNE